MADMTPGAYADAINEWQGKQYSHEITPPGYLPCTRRPGHDGPCALKVSPATEFTRELVILAYIIACLAGAGLLLWVA